MNTNFKPSSFSSNSSFSDDDFYNISNGEYTKFDTFDNDIDCACSNVLCDHFDSGSYFRYENIDVEQETDLSKSIEYSEKLNITTSSDTDSSKSASPVFISKDDEDLKNYHQTDYIKLEKNTSFRKRLQTKFTKRFLYKLNTDTYNLVSYKKHKSLSRTASVPKIIVISPTSPDYHNEDSGNDSDCETVNILQKQELESKTTSKKSYLTNTRKFFRKSI